jgi:hypothetical protein
MTLKNYRFLGDEAEVLGKRLDAARRSLKNSSSTWSIGYWTQVIDQLLLQWRQLPILHDSDAQITIIPRWTVEYDFYERTHRSEGYGFTDRAYERLFKHNADLDASWHAHRESRLAKAQ